MKKRIMAVFLACVTLLCAIGLTSCANQQTRTFDSMEDFNSADVKLGVLTGSNFDYQTKVNFPDSKRLQFNTVSDLLLNLEQGKIDGFLFDKACYSSILWEKSGFDIIEGDIADNEYGYIFSDSVMGIRIRDELNEFIEKTEASGKRDELEEKWLIG